MSDFEQSEFDRDSLYLFCLFNHSTMKKPNQNSISRRRFLGTTLLAAGTVSAPSLFGAPAYIPSLFSRKSGVNLGVITYSFRELPDQSAEATVSYIKQTGLTATELMGDPAESYAGKPEAPFSMREVWGAMRRANDENLSEEDKKKIQEMRDAMTAYSKEVAEWRSKVPMDKFKEVKKMFDADGISIYAFKPSTFSPNNSDVEIDYGFRAAKALGASHVTVEIPQDPAHSQRLGKFAAKHKIYMAYHGHEQQTPTVWDTALSQSDFNAINLDLGHWVAAGNPSPLDFIRSKHNHIKSMHVKDRKSPDNGKENVSFGTGDTPIVQVLQLMRDEKYTFPATIELEYPVPEGSDPVAEVRKCFNYCSGAIES